MPLLNAHLAELSESLVIMFLLSELTTEFFSMHHYACAQCPLGRALQNSSEILYATLFFSTALPPEVFNNLIGLSSELLTSVSVPQHVFV
jgi:hypothetical protein